MSVIRDDTKQNTKRFLISMIFALIIHGAAYFIIQYVFPIEPEEIPEYSGAVYVTIGESIAPIIKEPFEDKTKAVQEQEKEDLVAEESFKIQYNEVQERQITATKGLQAEKKESTSKEGIKKYIDKTIPPAYEPLSDIEKREEKVTPTLEEAKGIEEGLKETKKLPPEFLSAEEEEKPLLFDMERLDEVIEKSQQLDLKEKSEPAEPVLESHVAAKDSPLITWDSVGEERVLLSSGALPDIPSWVKEEGLDLKVVVSFAVTPEGHTTRLEIELSSGYSDVDTAILDTVRKLKFNPVSSKENVSGRINYVIQTK